MKIPFFNRKEEIKANPPSVMFADESKRGQINKVLLPNFLLRPPFGTPRFKDVITLRRVANTPQAHMSKQTIIDEVVSIPYSIVPVDEEDELTPVQESQIDELTNFFLNPNTRSQSTEYLMRVALNDVLDLDSGIWVKQFDNQNRMVEIVAADGATFLKNPDVHGSFENRDDIIPIGNVNIDKNTGEPIAVNPIGLTLEEARHKGAYFQFGFLTSSRPIAFGRREIVWFEKNPQSNQIYGKAPVETLLQVLQSLLYSIEYNLDYFEDNNVPKGFISMPGADEPEMDAFRTKWNDLQLKTNQDGLLKKNFHRVPMTNAENANFVRIQFSSAELQLLEEQSWFSKLVWSTYGVNPSELGFTENSNLATEINQSKVFKRKAILPLLRMLEYKINNDILSEWDFGSKFKFKFNTFDIDDEQKKWDLYKTQLETGARSINEIRKQEGLEEIDEGDFDAGVESIPVEEQEQEEESEETEEEIKPKNPDPKESEERAEKKNTLFFSEANDKEVMQQIKDIFKKREKEIIKALRLEANKDRLTQLTTEVKSFEDIFNSLGEILNLDGLKSIIDRVTESLFKKGMEDLSDIVNVNPQEANKEQINFLSKNTFSNIKGMEADLENKLKQQLRLAIINGDGIGKMAERVKSVFDVSENRAKMIARTESSRIEHFGQLDAAKKAGVAMKKYILIVKDKRTSDVSKAMDAKYGSEEKAIPLNENFEVTVKGKTYSGPVPPFMPNDRDTVLYAVSEDKSMKQKLLESLE